jgi:hypothetical protein
LQTGGRRGKQRLFQHGAEQHGALAGAVAIAGQFELGQGVEGEILRRTGVAVQAKDLALREVLLHLLAHVFLEAADEEVRDVIAAVVGLVAGRQHRGVEHAHQAGEALFPAVVRGGGQQDQGVRTLGQQFGQAVALGAIALVRDVVRLVDDDQIPPGVFQIVTILAVALEGIDRDDGPVVIVEGVVVGRDLATDALDAGGVQAREVDGEAVPQLLLELAHHALGRHHQDAPGLAATHQLGGQDAGFERLAQTDGIGNEQPRAQLPQHLMCGLELKRQRVHHAPMTQHHRLLLQRGLTQPRLDEEPGGDEGGRVVVDQLGLRRIDQGDVFELAEKQRLTIAHGFRHADAGQLPAPETTLVGIPDDPFLIANEGAGTGSRGLGQVHGLEACRMAAGGG